MFEEIKRWRYLNSTLLCYKDVASCMEERSLECSDSLQNLVLIRHSVNMLLIGMNIDNSKHNRVHRFSVGWTRHVEIKIHLLRQFPAF
jgi:hypothetical protein